MKPTQSNFDQLFHAYRKAYLLKKSSQAQSEVIELWNNEKCIFKEKPKGEFDTHAQGLIANYEKIASKKKSENILNFFNRVSKKGFTTKILININ